MKLIADSGSTKTDWCVIDGAETVVRLCGQGINPFQQERCEIDRVIETELTCRIPATEKIDEIHFYGAGCRAGMIPVMAEILKSHFTEARVIEVNSDLLAAARALLGHEPGIACILGTGSNSCLYDGSNIVKNIPPMGYILGDEGSGAVLGRMFVNALFKERLPEELRREFIKECGMELDEIITRVYRKPLGNRLLASFSPFILKNIGNAAVRDIVVRNFRDFFRMNIIRYREHESFSSLGMRCDNTPVSIIGSMAYYYERELREAALAEGFTVDKIEKSPMPGLISYHGKQ